MIKANDKCRKGYRSFMIQKLMQSFLSKQANSPPTNYPPQQHPFGFGTQMPPQRFNQNGIGSRGNSRTGRDSGPSGGPRPHPSGNHSGFMQNMFSLQSPDMSQTGATGGEETSSKTDSRVMGTLDNVQNGIKMAEKALPMLQEYGPAFKKVPETVQMLKGFMNTKSKTSKEPIKKKQISEDNNKLAKIKAEQKSRPKIKDKDSTPKMYI